MPEEVRSVDDTRRQRSFGTKLMSFVLVRIILGLVFVVVVISVFQFGFSLAARNPQVRRLLDASYLQALVGIAVTLLTYYWFVRWTEKRPVTELGARGAMRETGLGVALGATMFAATIDVLALLGYFRVVGHDAVTVLIAAAASAAVSAVFEEVVFRGIIFRLTEESLGTWLALAISALIFGAVHLLNPHSSLQGGVAIVLEAGIFLAAAYLTTRRLWFVIGAHFGWNFTEGGIFGATVSGNASRGLIKGTVSGPSLPFRRHFRDRSFSGGNRDLSGGCPAVTAIRQSAGQVHRSILETSWSGDGRFSTG